MWIIFLLSICFLSLRQIFFRNVLFMHLNLVEMVVDEVNLDFDKDCLGIYE